MFVKRIFCKSEENDHSNNQFCTKNTRKKKPTPFLCNLVRQTWLANISSFSASLKQPLSILLNSQLKSATSSIPCHILFFCIQCNAVNINNHDTEITPSQCRTVLCVAVADGLLSWMQFLGSKKHQSNCRPFREFNMPPTRTIS